MEPISENPIEETHTEPTSLNEALWLEPSKSIEKPIWTDTLNKENSFWIWIFLIIFIVLCAILWFVGYNYQIPVEVTNNGIVKDIPIGIENIEPIIQKNKTPEVIPHIEATESWSDTIINPTIWETPEKKVIEKTCIEDNCDKKCPETSIWNGEQCQEVATLKETENVTPTISDNHIIFAGGWYRWKKIDQYIDDSWKEVWMYEVSVDYIEKPVVLILGAYEPSIWNIRISQWTRIEKIILGWYYNQVVTGISKTIPTERHVFKETNTNDYFYISKWETTKWSLKRFGNVETIYYANENGNILIGNQPTPETLWIQDPNNIPENYYKKWDELWWKAGLDLLIQKWVIRVATKADADKWFDGLINSPTSYLSKNEWFPITDASDLEVLRKKYTPWFWEYRWTNYYVALKDFKLPGGMYWAFAFYVPKWITVTGDISNGALYNFGTMESNRPYIPQ